MLANNTLSKAVMEPTVSFDDNLVQFSSSFYGVLDNTQSICVSPYSVSAAFMLVMIGAGGNSRRQISSALFKDSTLSETEQLGRYWLMNKNLIDLAGEDITLATANRLYVNSGYHLKTCVINKAQTYFEAELINMDFTQSTAASEINNWVSDETRDKITDLVKPEWLNINTILVLVNAIYFRGTWETEFHPTNTMKENFYRSDNSPPIEVDMMKMNKKVPSVTRKSFSAISLPYKGNKFAMDFILPHKTDGLTDLESFITGHPTFFQELSSSFEITQLNIFIPKFVIESEIDLTEELPKLGVTDIFLQGTANFSRLVEGSTAGIYVSKAVHKVYIEVDEKGTEGTAATAVAITRQEGFNANHPFLFYIRNVETGVVLFIGRYKPT